MKKKILFLACVIALASLVSGCYIYTYEPPPAPAVVIMPEGGPPPPHYPPPPPPSSGGVGPVRSY